MNHLRPDKSLHQVRVLKVTRAMSTLMPNVILQRQIYRRCLQLNSNLVPPCLLTCSRTTSVSASVRPSVIVRDTHHPSHSIFIMFHHISYVLWDSPLALALIALFFRDEYDDEVDRVGAGRARAVGTPLD